MNLHKNKQEFYDTLLAVGNKLNTSPAIIEKDYYVTLFLDALSKRVPGLVFKGGTSLSKCYKIINRFSEDIDITLDSDNQSQSKKRSLKEEIINVCKELSFELMNEKDILSRRKYNRYEVKYPMLFNESGIKQYLLIETVFMTKSYPVETKSASSMIYDFWKEIGDVTAISEYEMQPFNIHTQTLVRTLIDKVFAICDYALSDNITGHSRHIYDLYKLLKVITLDNSMISLIKEVREERKQYEFCHSAQDKFNIQNILKYIIDKKIYYKDYEEVTKKVLFDNTDYETSITAIQEILESGIFSKN